MVYRILKIVIQVGLSGAITVLAQNTCGNTKLECLLPTALHTNTPTFNFFNQTFATQIGQLPLATPASGFIFTFDKQKGVYTAAQESFGPLARSAPRPLDITRSISHSPISASHSMSSTAIVLASSRWSSFIPRRKVPWL